MGVLLARVKTEMSFCFSVSGASQEEDVSSSGGNLGELIKGQALSFCLANSGSCGVGEFEGTDSESLGELEESVVVGDGSDDCNDSGCVSVGLV